MLKAYRKGVVRIRVHLVIIHSLTFASQLPKQTHFHSQFMTPVA